MADEYIVGKHSVLEALRSGRTIHKIWLAEQSKPQAMQAIVNEAKPLGIIIQQVDKRKLDQLAAQNKADHGNVPHQGVIAQVAAYDYVEVEDILTKAKSSGEQPLLFILDEIEDPHNLGSILRTAECTGVHGIIIPKRRSVGLTATVSKTSAGAIEYVPVARVSNIAQTIDKLKEQGIWIAGADGSAERDVFEMDLAMPLAVVIGNENKGIGRLIKEKCDFLVKLPMRGSIHSLNASVAAGVFMYEILRQRRLQIKGLQEP